jgi:phage host-nuclease inhibitor protein Gam
MKIDVIEQYNDLLKRQQDLNDQMSNLGREKDYKVQKIEKHYQSQIDNLVRDQEALAIVIANIEDYIKKTSGATTLVARNATKKERD